MRTIVLVPLTALVAVIAGCGSKERNQAARAVPDRDLTLVTQTPEVKIASPVETRQLRMAPARRSSPLEPKVVLAAAAAPLAALGAGSAPVLVPAEPAARPVGTEATPANDRELLPGKTVTLIPASTGPSTGSDQAEEFPPEGRTMVVGRGGTCRGRGRGPGIGIAAVPRPDFR